MDDQQSQGIPLEPLVQGTLSVPPNMPKPSQPMQETIIVPSSMPPGGGISFDIGSGSDRGNEPPVPPPPPPESTPSPTPDNPFIPQVVVPTAPGGSPPHHGGSALPRRLLMVVVFLFLAVGLFFGGRVLLGIFFGSKEVALSYWGLWENDTTVRSVIAAFESANPKIKISYIKQSPRQYRERLTAAISRGEGPDLFRFHNTWVPMLRDALAPVPKTVMTPSEFSSTFYPIATNDLVADATIYGIPLMIEGLGLYINEDLFAKAGVAVPATWEDVLNIVPKLTVKSDATITTSAIALGTTGNVENWSDILATMMMQNGANLSNPVTKEAEETLVFYRKFADPTDPMYTWNDTLDNSVYAFAIGKVAMTIAPSWRAFDIKQMNPDLRFKIVPIPQLPGSTVTWGSYWVEGVSAKSKNQEAAWKFLQYLSSREVLTKFYTEAAKTRLFGEIYARVDLANSVENDPYVGAFVQQAKTAKSFPLASRTFDNGINDKMIKYMEDAINGLSQGSAPSAVLQTAASGFRQVLTTYGLTTGAAPPAPKP